MKHEITKNFKKERKIRKLQSDYDVYSKGCMLFTLKGEVAIKHARNFHDRAITCMDLADLIMRIGLYPDALICVKNAILDLKKAITIYKKLHDETGELQKCTKYISVFEKKVEEIKELSISKRISEPMEIDHSSLIEATMFRTPKTTPVKSKKSRHREISSESEASIDDQKTFS